MSGSAASLRALVRARDGDNCSICGLPIDFTLPPGTFMGPSLEHVTPVAAGGSRSDLQNLRLAHGRPCNHAKGAVHDGIDWASVRDLAQNPAKRVVTGRYERQLAAALAKAQAAHRQPRGINVPTKLPRPVRIAQDDQAAGRRIRELAESIPDARRHRDRGSERARQIRRAKTGARRARGPWGGLIVVEERGPWGGIVRQNSVSLPARSQTA